MMKFPDRQAAEKHYNRQRFRDLRNVTIADCCDEWREGCWDWLNCATLHKEKIEGEQ